MDAEAQLEEARRHHAARHAAMQARAAPAASRSSASASDGATPASTAGASGVATAPRAAVRGGADTASVATRSGRGDAEGNAAGGASEALSSAAGIARSAVALMGRALSAARRGADLSHTDVPSPPAAVPPPPPPAFCVGQRVVYSSASRPPARGVVTAVERTSESEPASYVLLMDDDSRVVHTVETRLAAEATDGEMRNARRAAQEAEDAALAAALQAEEDAAAAAHAAAPPHPLAGLNPEASPVELMAALVDMMSALPSDPGASGVARQFVTPGGGNVRVVFGAPAAQAAVPLSALLGLGGVVLGGAGARFVPSALAGMPFHFGAAGDGGLNLTYEQLLALQERLGGSVPRGATAEQVAALPTRRYVPREGAAAADATCSICLADFEAGDELRALPCSHAYHSGCIDQWLKTSRQCPCCRRELTQTE